MMTPMAGRTETTSEDRRGAAAVGALAAVLTVTDVVVLLRYDIDAAWALIQGPVLVLAWGAVFAWLRRRWVLAGGGLLAMLGAYGGTCTCRRSWQSCLPPWPSPGRFAPIGRCPLGRILGGRCPNRAQGAPPGGARAGRSFWVA